MQRSVAIVGLGYVGLPLAILAAKKGYEVYGIDYDAKRVQTINDGKSPFRDASIERDLQSITLHAASNYEAIPHVQTIIVCVPTPVDGLHNPDLKPLISACKAVADKLQRGQLVIIESTINPGVCEEIVLPILERETGLRCGHDFFLAHCPERINPGDETWHVGNIPRVIGGNDPKSLELAKIFYFNVIDAPVKLMHSLKEAEAVKVVENSFRDINIAFVNELAMSFSKLDIDVVNVIDGASTKPFAFMPHYPGAGVGGHCIPVDPYYLIEYAHSKGFEHHFLKTAREINNKMPHFTVERLTEALNLHKKPLRGSKVTVLGLSYKPNVGDLRESPALDIVNILRDNGADVAVFDPYVEHPDGLKTSHTDQYAGVIKTLTHDNAKERLLSAIAAADAIVIATSHKLFAALSTDNLKALGVRIIVDGRNFMDKASIEAAGLTYKGIGR